MPVRCRLPFCCHHGCRSFSRHFTWFLWLFWFCVRFCGCVLRFFGFSMQVTVLVTHTFTFGSGWFTTRTRLRIYRLRVYTHCLRLRGYVHTAFLLLPRLPPRTLRHRGSPTTFLPHAPTVPFCTVRSAVGSCGYSGSRFLRLVTFAALPVTWVLPTAPVTVTRGCHAAIPHYGYWITALRFTAGCLHTPRFRLPVLLHIRLRGCGSPLRLHHVYTHRFTHFGCVLCTHVAVARLPFTHARFTGSVGCTVTRSRLRSGYGCVYVHLWFTAAFGSAIYAHCGYCRLVSSVLTAVHVWVTCYFTVWFYTTYVHGRTHLRLRLPAYVCYATTPARFGSYARSSVLYTLHRFVRSRLPFAGWILVGYVLHTTRLPGVTARYYLHTVYTVTHIAV